MNCDYIPKVTRIKRIVNETPDVKTFYLDYPSSFMPGQFLEVSCFGIGEAPISISSCPEEEFLKITFRRAGAVTTGLFNLKQNYSIGIRGPFGKGFPVTEIEGKNLLFIAGGIGLAPLRSLIKYLLCRQRIEPVAITLVYGCRSPQELLYKREFSGLSKKINLILTVDTPDAAWKGNTGVVTEVLNKIKIIPSLTKAFICGPEIMMHFTTKKLKALGLAPADIILSLERHMRCGVGKCGHCYVGDKFVCRDGPVFTCEEYESMIVRK